MAKLVTYSNPLDPLSRKTEAVEVQFVSELFKNIEYDTQTYDLVVSRNNVIVHNDFEIVEGDVVGLILVPKGSGGKNILRTVAMIALAVAAPYAAAGILGATVATMGITGSLLAAGLIIAGSYVINALLPPQLTDTSSDFSNNSQTYSWGIDSNLIQQGSALPKLFGTHRVTPPCISKYIETIDNKQYLNALFALNDGELTYIGDIKINDNPIGNYDGVTYDIRYGTNNQSLIGSFDNTRYLQSFSNKLESGADWDYFTTQGDSVIGITVGLNFPKGLYKVIKTGKHAGDIVWEAMYVYCQYYNGSTWINVGNPFTYSYIEGDNGVPEWCKSAFTKTFTIPNLSSGTYQIRLRAVRQVRTDHEYVETAEVWVEYMTEEIGDDFIYPNTALLAVRALATDQLSGSFPNFKVLISNGINNPADVALSILNEVGIDNSLIDTVRFGEWRTFCENNGYTCNLYLDTTTNVRKALDFVATCGRARIEQFGSHFSVIADMPNAIPVQGFMFGMGNILEDSFKEEFLPIADRANVIEVTYNDEDNDYEKTVVEVSNDTYDNELEENRISLNFVGCTNRAMGIKHAKYLLNCNRYLTNTASWESDVDALVCRFGDIVQVSHDVPQWGYSGRVVSANSTSVILDRDVDMDSGKTYYLKIKHNSDNSIEERQVVYSSESTEVLTLTSPFTVTPSQYDLYSFGEIGKVTKLMRIIRIGTSGNELRRTITAIEYNDGVYNDSGTITPVLISDFGVTNLKCYDYITYASDKTIKTVLHINWNGNAISYNVKYRKTDGSEWTSVKVNDCFYAVEVSEGTYDVVVTDGFGQSQSTQYVVLGKNALPSPVPWVTVESNKISWGASPDIDIAGYEVRFHVGSNTDWGTAQSVNTAGLFTSSPITLPLNVYGEVTVLVKPQDTTGHQSVEAASATVTLAGAVVRNSLSEIDEAALGWPGTITGGAVSFGKVKATGTTLMWGTNTASMWLSDGTTLMWNDVYSELSYEFQFDVFDKTEGSNLLLSYAYQGASFSIQYRQVGLSDMWISDYTDMYTNDDYLMWTIEDWMPWPGAVPVSIGTYDFLITIEGGQTQGVIEDLVAIIDAPDILETLSNVSISSSGATRLPITKSYRSIRAVKAQIIASGSARTVEIFDKSTAGPLAKCYDFSHNLVDGVIDATVEGY